MSIKILKNTTGSVIELESGLSISANSQVTVNSQDYAELANSDDIYVFIGNGSIVVNDGSNDLSIGDAVGLVKSSFINLSDNSLIGPQGPQGDAGAAGFGIYAFGKTQANGTFDKGRGILVQKNGTGIYEYTFTTPTPDTFYSPVVALENVPNSTDTNAFITNKTVNGFTVTIGVGDNGTTPDNPQDTDHTISVLGEAGPQGITSAYESWLNVGNVGSEQDFLDSLKIDSLKISPNDQSTSSFLESKFVTPNNKTSIVTVNEGVNEQLSFSVNPINIGTSELNNDEGFLNEASHDALPQDNPHNVNKIQVGLGNVDNTSDSNKPVSTAQQAALDLKYDTSNPQGYETPAQLDARDTVNRNRANHTGTQLASTISDFTAAVKSAETNTSLQLVGNILRYTDEQGIDTDLDLSTYLDDTNLARIVSGSIDPVTNIVTFQRDDSSTFTVDFSSIVGGDIIIENEVHVALNGDDSNGNGSISKPYRTLKKALDEITLLSPSSSNPFCVKMGPGVFNEDPMVCPEWVIINGCGPRTRINANNVNANLLTIAPNSSLRGMSFQGVTSSSNACVLFNSSNGGVSSFLDVFVTACSNGIILQNSSNLFSVTGSGLLAAGVTGDIIRTTDNTRLTLQGASINGNSTSTIGLKVTGSSEAIVFNVRARFCDVAIDSTGDGELNITQIEAQTCNTPLRKTGNATVILNGGDFDARNVVLNNVANVEGYFINRLEDETQFRINSELSVGLPSLGKETALGEGDSYRNGMLVYTFDGSSFVNVTTNAQQGGSTFALPNGNIDSAIYVTTAFPNSSPLFWYGLKIDVITALNSGSGEMVSEYWNGSSWVEFNTMSEGELEENYEKYANAFFQRSQDEQLYFDNAITQDWTPNDPVSLGADFRWVRFRVSQAILTPPVFNIFKIHSSRTEVNADGYIQYFGKARRYKNLTSDLIFEAAANSPSNQDIYLSDNLPVGKRENEFFTAGLLSESDQTGAVFKIPGDLDTSCKVRLRLTYTSADTGTARFRVYWATSSDGSFIGQSTGQVPSSFSNEREVFVQESYPVDDTQRTVIVDAELPEAVARRADGDSDLLWLGFRIDNTSTVNPIVLVNVTIDYVSNESGGHL